MISHFFTAPHPRFAGLPPKGEASFLAPPLGELSPQATEGAHLPRSG